MAQHNLFQKKPRLYLDGGMGTMLQKSGMPAGEIPEKYNIEHPEQITAIHKAFLAAGSDIVYANTFGANRLKMKKSGYSVQELISAGIACGKAATAGTCGSVRRWCCQLFSVPSGLSSPSSLPRSGADGCSSNVLSASGEEATAWRSWSRLMWV